MKVYYVKIHSKKDKDLKVNYILRFKVEGYKELFAVDFESTYNGAAKSSGDIKILNMLQVQAFSNCNQFNAKQKNEIIMQVLNDGIMIEEAKKNHEKFKQLTELINKIDEKRI